MGSTIGMSDPCEASLTALAFRLHITDTTYRYLLLGAACIMGAVSIWSMHYIGNRAISMAQGQANVQIQYSPGFTAGSFFLPIIVVGAAFYIFSTSDNVSIVWTVTAGIMTGVAVCGMHYMGQGGIANYKLIYHPAYIVGSAIVSISATTVALGLFFYLNSIWTNSWWKRVACACWLAAAISGMHWVATKGTSYRIIPNEIDMASGLSREATVVVVICLVRLALNFGLLTLLTASRPSAAASSSSPLLLSDSVPDNVQQTKHSRWFSHAPHSIWMASSWSRAKACSLAARLLTHTLREYVQYPFPQCDNFRALWLI